MPKATSRNPKTTKRDVLSAAAIRKRVAQQRIWCVINRSTGDVIDFCTSRARARRYASQTPLPTSVVHAELRITGQRA